jgi:hypothetical protein
MLLGWSAATFADEPGVRKMRIRVADENGDPIAGANIHVSVWAPKPFPANRDYLTDDKGEALIERPEEIRILRIWPNKPGYVTLFAQWWPERDGKAMPDDFTFSMKKGVEIGGTVEDEEGKPIKDARVEARLVHPGEEGLAAGPIYSTWLATGDDPDGAVKTDAQGFWSLDNVPPDDDVQVSLIFQHPDYVSDRNWGGLQGEQKVTFQSLRRKSAAIVMKKGIRLSGKVVGGDMKPVSNAVVIWGDDPYFEWGSQEVRTDENGGYLLPALPPGEMNVTVLAPGWAPMMQTVALAPGKDRADFELKEGKPLRLKFVDADTGVVVPGVHVGIESWRAGKSLYNHRHPNVIDTRIPIAANDAGVYEWRWAPEDEVQYYFYKEGYGQREKVSLIAKGEEQTIELVRAPGAP